MKAIATLFALALFVAVGCKTTQKVAAYTPTGIWSYVVKDTPMGEIGGMLTLMKEGDVYSGKIEGDTGTTDLKDVKMEGNTMTCTFVSEGYEVAMKLLFAGETATGTASAAGYDFPVVANRTQK